MGGIVRYADFREHHGNKFKQHAPRLIYGLLIVNARFCVLEFN